MLAINKKLIYIFLILISHYLFAVVNEESFLYNNKRNIEKYTCSNIQVNSSEFRKSKFELLNGKFKIGFVVQKIYTLTGEEYDCIYIDSMVQRISSKDIILIVSLENERIKKEYPFIVTNDLPFVKIRHYNIKFGYLFVLGNLNDYFSNSFMLSYEMFFETPNFFKKYNFMTFLWESGFNYLVPSYDLFFKKNYQVFLNTGLYYALFKNKLLSINFLSSLGSTFELLETEYFRYYSIFFYMKAGFSIAFRVNYYSELGLFTDYSYAFSKHFDDQKFQFGVKLRL